MNASDGARDFTGDEGFSSTWAFMIEKDSVRRKHSVRFPVVHCHPVGIDLSSAVRAPRIKCRIFVLRRRRRPKHLRRSCLIEATGDTAHAHRLEDSCSAQSGDVAREFGYVETYPHVALRAQVIDLVGTHVVDEAGELFPRRKITMMKVQTSVATMGILIDMVDAVGIERASTPDNAVNFVAFAK